MAAKIYETYNYDSFELHEFNRNVNNLQPLIESFKKYGWIDACPMHVVKNGSGKLKIKAGHNRFAAARYLNIPVKYVICNDTISIYELEKATSPWVTGDYLDSYCRRGMPPYLVVKEYRDRTGISLMNCIAMLGGESAGSNNKMTSFKTGTYTLGNQHHALLVEDIILVMKNAKISFAATDLLVRAISKTLRIPTIDPKKLRQKIKTFSHFIKKQPNLESYLLMLEDIYNRNSQEKCLSSFWPKSMPGIDP